MHLGVLLLLLFDAQLPHRAVSSTRTERTVLLTSLYPVPCLWHILGKCSVNAEWMDDAICFINHAGINYLKLVRGLLLLISLLLDPSLPPHNSFPSSAVHSKSTQKDTDQKIRKLCNKHPCVALMAGSTAHLGEFLLLWSPPLGTLGCQSVASWQLWPNPCGGVEAPLE